MACLHFICLLWAFLLISVGSGDETARIVSAAGIKLFSLQDDTEKKTVIDSPEVLAWTSVPVKVKFEVHDEVTFGSIFVQAGDGSSSFFIGTSCHDLKLVESGRQEASDEAEVLEGYEEGLELQTQQTQSHDSLLESQSTEDKMEAVKDADVMEPSTTSNAFSGIHSTSVDSSIDEIDVTLQPSFTPRSNLDSQPSRYSLKCEDYSASTVVYELEYTYADPGRFAMILQFQDPVTDEVIWKLEGRVLVRELLLVELGPSDLLAINESDSAFAYAHLSVGEEVTTAICPDGMITWNWTFGDGTEGFLTKNSGVARSKREAVVWQEENDEGKKNSRRNYMKIVPLDAAAEITKRKSSEEKLTGKYGQSLISSEATDGRVKKLDGSENVPRSGGLLTEMAVQQVNGQNKELEEMAKLAEEGHKFQADGSPGSDGGLRTTSLPGGTLGVSSSVSPSHSPSQTSTQEKTTTTTTTSGSLEGRYSPIASIITDITPIPINQFFPSSNVNDLLSSTGDSDRVGSRSIYPSDTPTSVESDVITSNKLPTIEVSHIYHDSGVYDFTAVLCCDEKPIRRKVVDAAFTVVVPFQDVMISAGENDTLLILRHETAEEAGSEISEGSTSSLLLRRDKDSREEREESHWATRSVILRVDIGRGTLWQSPLLETGDGTLLVLETTLVGQASGSWSSQIEYSYKSSGDFRPKVTVTNPLGSVEVHLNTTIQVQQLPTKVTLIPSQYFASCGDAVTFQALSSGSHLRYDWTLPSGELLKDAGDKLTRVYNTTFYASISVTVYNEALLVLEPSSPLPKASALLTVERRLESSWIETGLEGDPLVIEKGVKTKLTAFVSPPITEGEQRRYFWYLEDGYSNLTLKPHIFHTYKDVGPRDIHLKVENQVSTVSSPSLSILVVERLSNARIAPHDDVHRGEYSSFKVLLDRGSDVNYQWNFGDGTKTKFSMKPHTFHRYKEAGVYLLTVTLTTPLNDSVVATSEVFVLEEDGFCKTPKVLKFHPDLAVHREFERNQEILLEPDIERDCRLTRLSPSYKWRLWDETGAEIFRNHGPNTQSPTLLIHPFYDNNWSGLWPFLFDALPSASFDVHRQHLSRVKRGFSPHPHPWLLYKEGPLPRSLSKANVLGILQDGSYTTQFTIKEEGTIVKASYNTTFDVVAIRLRVNFIDGTEKHSSPLSNITLQVEVASPSPNYTISWGCQVLYSHGEPCFQDPDPWGSFTSSSHLADGVLAELHHLWKILHGNTYHKSAAGSFSPAEEGRDGAESRATSHGRSGRRGVHPLAVVNDVESRRSGDLPYASGSSISSTPAGEGPDFLKNRWRYIETITFPASLLIGNPKKFLFKVVCSHRFKVVMDEQLVVVEDDPVDNIGIKSNLGSQSPYGSSSRMVFESTCVGCSEDDIDALQYKWNLMVIIQSVQESRTYFRKRAELEENLRKSRNEDEDDEDEKVDDTPGRSLQMQSNFLDRAKDYTKASYNYKEKFQLHAERAFEVKPGDISDKEEMEAMLGDLKDLRLDLESLDVPITPDLINKVWQLYKLSGEYRLEARKRMLRKRAELSQNRVRRSDSIRSTDDQEAAVETSSLEVDTDYDHNHNHPPSMPHSRYHVDSNPDKTSKEGHTISSSSVVAPGDGRVEAPPFVPPRTVKDDETRRHNGEGQGQPTNHHPLSLEEATRTYSERMGGGDRHLTGGISGGRKKRDGEIDWNIGQEETNDKNLKRRYLLWNDLVIKYDSDQEEEVESGDNGHQNLNPILENTGNVGESAEVDYYTKDDVGDTPPISSAENRKGTSDETQGETGVTTGDESSVVAVDLDSTKEEKEDGEELDVDGRRRKPPDGLQLHQREANRKVMPLQQISSPSLNAAVSRRDLHRLLAVRRTQPSSMSQKSSSSLAKGMKERIEEKQLDDNREKDQNRLFTTEGEKVKRTDWQKQLNLGDGETTGLVKNEIGETVNSGEEKKVKGELEEEMGYEHIGKKIHMISLYDVNDANNDSRQEDNAGDNEEDVGVSRVASAWGSNVPRMTPSGASHKRDIAVLPKTTSTPPSQFPSHSITASGASAAADLKEEGDDGVGVGESRGLSRPFDFLLPSQTRERRDGVSVSYFAEAVGSKTRDDERGHLSSSRERNDHQRVKRGTWRRADDEYALGGDGGVISRVSGSRFSDIHPNPLSAAGRSSQLSLLRGAVESSHRASPSLSSSPPSSRMTLGAKPSMPIALATSPSPSPTPSLSSTSSSSQHMDARSPPPPSRASYTPYESPLLPSYHPGDKVLDYREYSRRRQKYKLNPLYPEPPVPYGKDFKGNMNMQDANYNSELGFEGGLSSKRSDVAIGFAKIDRADLPVIPPPVNDGSEGGHVYSSKSLAGRKVDSNSRLEEDSTGASVSPSTLPSKEAGRRGVHSQGKESRARPRAKKGTEKSKPLEGDRRATNKEDEDADMEGDGDGGWASIQKSVGPSFSRDVTEGSTGPIRTLSYGGYLRKYANATGEVPDFSCAPDQWHECRQSSDSGVADSTLGVLLKTLGDPAKGDGVMRETSIEKEDPFITEESQMDVWWFRRLTSTGLHQPVLVIYNYKDLLIERFSYVLHLSTFNPRTERRGYAKQVIRFSPTPTLENCQIISLPTRKNWFQASCQNVDGKFHPVYLQWSYQFMKSKEKTILYHGSKTSIQFPLPSGTDANGYTRYVSVEAIDGKGVASWFPKSFEVPVLPRSSSEEVLSLFMDISSLVNENPSLFLQEVRTLAYELNLLEDSDLAETVLDNILALTFYQDRCENNLKEAAVNPSSGQSLSQSIHRESHGSSLYDLLKSVNLLIACARDHLAEKIVELPVRDEMEVLQVLSALQMTVDAQMTADAKKSISSMTYSRVISSMQKASLKMWWNYKAELRTEAAKQYFLLSSSVLDAQTSIYDWDSSFAQLSGLVIKMLFNVMKVETTARFREESPLSYSTSTLAFVGYVSDSKTINLWNKSVPYYFEPSWIHHRAHMVQSLVHQRSPYLISSGEAVSSQVVNIDLDLKNSLMKEVQVRLLRTLESTGLEDYDFRREGVLTPQSLNVYEFEVGKEHEDMTFSVVLQVVQVFNSKYPVAAVVLICEDLEELHNPMYKKEVTATVVFSQVQLNVPAGALSRGTKLLVIMDKNVYENNWARHNKSSENQGGKFKVAGWWSECLVWNDTNWVGGDCSVVEDSTTWDATTCRCKSVHSVYGAKVIPILEEGSMIDVNELMLVETYGALYFIITVLIIYFVLVIVLQTSERHRLKRRNIWLRDNKPGHEWAYLLTIKTGTQWNAGTTSKVYAIIHGTHGMSETRELQSSQTGQLFTRGSLCTFILTTAENLGDILKVQVWHDNSGGNSSSWYVCETSVADLVMGALYAYPCYRWLSVHAEDAKVEREITLESPTTFFQDFEHFLPQYASEHMLWSSLLTTSNTAKFFRLQRLTICLIVCLCLGTVSLAVVQMINDEHTMMVPDMHIESLLFGFMIAALLLPIQWLLEMIFKMSNRLEEKEYNNKTVLDTLRPIVEASSETSLDRDSPADNSDEDDSCELLDPNAPVWSRLTEWANSVEMLNCHTSVLHPALHQHTTDNVLSKRIPSASSGPIGVTSETPETSITTELPQMAGAGECLSANRLDNPEESDAKKCSPLATYQFYSELSRTFGYLFAFFKKPKKPKYKKRTRHSDEEGWIHKEEEEDEEEDDADENFSLKSNIAFIFSQCIGWIVCCVFFALCCMFLFVRGSGMPADYGALWVHIIYVSLCCSIFIMQPLVIVVYTLYKVCMYRWLGCRGCISNCVTVPLDQVVSIWNHYQSVLSRNNRTNTRADKEKLLHDRQRKRDLRFAHPPAEDYLLKCREKELRQERVSRLFISTLGHILLLALLLIISSKANVTERFRLNQAIHNAMINGSCLDKDRYLDPCTEAESFESCNLKKNPNYMSFKDITTKDEWWKWANSELLALTYNVDSDYTSYVIFCDTSSIIIGTPRLRKYVMKSEECVASKFKFDNNTSLADLLKVKKCYPDYIDVAHIFGFNGFENKEYEWDAHFLAIIQGMFSQYSYTELKQYLPSNRLSAVFLLYLLGSQNWIDVSTRAVITEFTLYHPTSKIYTTINMLAEFPSVSGVKVTTFVWSTDVERYRGGWAYVCMCGEILLLAIAMYYLYHSAIYLYSCQFRVWQSFWGMLDLLMTFFSWSYVVCLMLRVQIAEDITWQLQVAYFRTFVNLKSLVTWDDILEAKMGIMVAVHSLRCLELLKYIPRLRRLGLILAGAAKDVLVISIFLLLMLVCCIFLGYLWFNTVLWEFHTISEVVLTTFRILIAHLPFLNYIEENTSGLLAVLGKLYYLVNFVLLFQLTRSLFVAAFIYSHKSYVAVSSTDIKLEDIQKYFVSKWEILKQKITKKTKDVDINRKDTVPPDFYMAEIEMQISQVQNSLNSLANSLGLILEQIPDFEDSSVYCESLSSNEDRSRSRKLSGDSNSSWKPEEFKVGQVKSSTFKSELEKLLEPLQSKVLEIVNQDTNQEESSDIFEGLAFKGENVEERVLDTTFNMDAFTDVASCQTEIEALSRKWNLASLSSTIKVQAEDNGEQLEKFLKDVSAASVGQKPVTSFGKYGKTCGKLNAKFPSKVPSAADSLNAIQNVSSFEANQKQHHKQATLQVFDAHNNLERPVQSSPATMVGSNLRRTKTHGRGKGNVDVLDIESFKTDSDEEVSL